MSRWHAALSALCFMIVALAPVQAAEKASKAGLGMSKALADTIIIQIGKNRSHLVERVKNEHGLSDADANKVIDILHADAATRYSKIHNDVALIFDKYFSPEEREILFANGKKPKAEWQAFFANHPIGQKFVDHQQTIGAEVETVTSNVVKVGVEKGLREVTKK